MTREHTVRIPSGFESEEEEHLYVLGGEGTRIEIRFSGWWIEMKQVWDDEVTVATREGLASELDWLHETIETERWRNEQK